MIGGRLTSAIAIGCCASGLWTVLIIAMAAAEEPRVASPEAVDLTAVQWQPVVLRLSSRDSHPWWSFPVAIRFEHGSTGDVLNVEGCWDGDRKWQVGFAPPRPGVWTWSSSSEDLGLDGHAGRIQVSRPTAEEIRANPNYRGRLRVSGNGRYFESADGTPRFLLADTLWAGNTARCGLGRDTDGPFYQYLEDRQAKGFNTVLMSLLHGFGDLPNHPSGDRNEGGHAFQKGDLHRLNALYFQALDTRMNAIWARGFVAAHPIMWWGKTRNCVFDLTWAARLTAYCAARYAAYPGLWSLSGEYQYAFADCGWTPQAFHELGAAVQRHNPFQRPLSLHPSARLDWDPPHNCQSSRPYHEAEWLDHHWLQTGQSRERMFNIVARARENLALTPVKPVFCSEAYYDVSDDPDQAYHARWQAWVALLNGCAGYGYGAHGIWQFYDPEDPQGETGKSNRRTVPWSKALRFDGSNKIRHVGAFAGRYPWWRLEPHRDWLTVDGRVCPQPDPDDLTPPHVAAIPGRLCVVYIPRGNASRTLKLGHLNRQDYRAVWWNPRTGKSEQLAEGPRGIVEWTIPRPPLPVTEDWVLVLSK